MITVPEAVQTIIRQTPFLEEALSRGIINLSALSRQIRPEIEKYLLKNVTEGSILMALKRLPTQLRSETQIRRVFERRHEIIVRSNLLEFTLLNSDFSTLKHKKIVEECGDQKHFITITQGIFETTIIASGQLEDKIESILEKDKIIFRLNNLSSITIRLPVKNVLTPGIYYSLLKFLAWEGINIVEVVSTFTEFTIILEDKETDRAFSVLKKSLSY